MSESIVHTHEDQTVGQQAAVHYAAHGGKLREEARLRGHIPAAESRAAEARAADEAIPYNGDDAQAIFASAEKAEAMERTAAAEAEQTRIEEAAATMARKGRVALAESTVFADRNQGDLILDALETSQKPHVKGSQRGGSETPVSTSAYHKLLEENRNR
jgi:hypothetical protein